MAQETFHEKVEKDLTEKEAQKKKLSDENTEGGKEKVVEPPKPKMKTAEEMNDDPKPLVDEAVFNEMKATEDGERKMSRLGRVLDQWNYRGWRCRLFVEEEGMLYYGDARKGAYTEETQARGTKLEVRTELEEFVDEQEDGDSE